MTDVLESFTELSKMSMIKENAKEFIKHTSVVERVLSFKELCKIAGSKFNKDVKDFEDILNGSLTKGIPLLTVGRFYAKYIGNFGKTLTFSRGGNFVKISMSEIDTAFSEISGRVYNIFCRISGDV